MARITSPHNPRLKSLQRLSRARERARSRLFFAEGEDLIEAAAHAGQAPVEGFRVIGSKLGPPSFHDVSPEALHAVSALASGARVIGIYEQRWSDPTGPLCVYLHGVGDPGNVGTIVRSAHAFGASCVALGPGCADPHSPKAVRASMGAIFAVALARASGVEELPGTRIGLSATAGERLAELGPTATAAPLTLLVGAEREGLPAELLLACEHAARIPIAIVAESLNAAMAATVALYELSREGELAAASSRVRTS